MIFTCKTTNLNKAIQTVQRAISSKPSTPIFSGIHLIADNNILEIQAMDLNMAIACSIEAEIQEKGEIVVSAKHFSELMRKLPGENVTIVKNKEEKIETGLKKFGAMLGDNVEIGCGSVLNPGTVIGKNTNVYPLSSVRGVVPSNSIYKKQNEIVEKQ